MNINKIRTLKIKKVLSDTSIKTILSLFKEQGLKYAVVYVKNTIIGIISEKELTKAYFDGKDLLEEAQTIVSKQFHIINNTCSIKDIIKIIDYDPNAQIIIGNDENQPLGIITKDMVLEYFYNKIKTKISNTMEKENTMLNFIEVINMVEELHLKNKELEQIFESSPNAFVIQDNKGNTLRLNKEFENITGLKRENIIGRNVKNLEEEGIYNPAVGLLVLQAKRRISVLQKLQNGKEALVTGVPIYDEEGNIFRVVLNSLNYKEISSINNYYSEKKEKRIKTTNETPIIYESMQIQVIMDLINQIKDVDSTILMTGETGVGKGVFARHIHENSRRKKFRMVEINCGAIPETLIESELFGYEAGAFTGASKKGKPGLIELADQGTLFLDEIAEMPMQLQVKLLQVIQEKEIIRVGGTNPIKVDVRIIAATNKDIQEMVNQERFRSDLFYRLNVIPIKIPPLRERKSDIISMSKYFLEKYKKKYNKHADINKSTSDAMLEYEWPGNVRELENMIERLVVTNLSKMSEKEKHKPETLKLNYTSAYSGHQNSLENIVSLEQAKMELEKKIITLAYNKHKSSYKVAEALKISQSTANRKINEYIKAYSKG